MNTTKEIQLWRNNDEQAARELRLIADSVAAGVTVIDWQERSRPMFEVVDFDSPDFELLNERGREAMRQSEFRQIEQQRRKVQL